MRFLQPELLLGLIAVPIVALAWLWLRHRGRSGLAAAGALAQSDSARPGGRRLVPIVLQLLALTLLLTAFARPQADIDLPRVEGTAILAFDVSNSMLAEDLEPNRMEAAKAAAHVFIDNQPTTVRVGIVSFNDGGVITQTPTDDKDALHAAVDRLTPDGGTALPQGIFTSLNAIAEESIELPEGGIDDLATADIGFFGSSVVVLLSDGEQTQANDPSAVVQLAANAGVRITTVGVGSPEGTVVELDGFNIATALDEDLLRGIADATGGTYLQATTEADLTEIYDTIDLELTVRGESVEITALFAAAGALLLVVSGLASMRWMGRMP